MRKRMRIYPIPARGICDGLRNYVLCAPFHAFVTWELHSPFAFTSLPAKT